MIVGALLTELHKVDKVFTTSTDQGVAVATRCEHCGPYAVELTKVDLAAELTIALMASSLSAWGTLYVMALDLAEHARTKAAADQLTRSLLEEFR